MHAARLLNHLFVRVQFAAGLFVLVQFVLVLFAIAHLTVFPFAFRLFASQFAVP